MLATVLCIHGINIRVLLNLCTWDIDSILL